MAWCRIRGGYGVDNNVSSMIGDEDTYGYISRLHSMWVDRVNLSEFMKLWALRSLAASDYCVMSIA